MKMEPRKDVRNRSSTNTTPFSRPNMASTRSAAAATVHDRSMKVSDEGHERVKPSEDLAEQFDAIATAGVRREEAQATTRKNQFESPSMENMPSRQIEPGTNTGSFKGPAVGNPQPQSCGEATVETEPGK